MFRVIWKVVLHNEYFRHNYPEPYKKLKQNLHAFQ